MPEGSGTRLYTWDNVAGTDFGRFVLVGNPSLAGSPSCAAEVDGLTRQLLWGWWCFVVEPVVVEGHHYYPCSRGRRRRRMVVSLVDLRH